MRELTIESAQDRLKLVLGPVEGVKGEGSFRARLDGGATGPTVEVSVYDIHYDTLASFFADVASNWRGWAAAKSWYSLEGHLNLDATSDRLGHVFLRARLRSMDIASDWDVSATLLLEAGQLDGIAADARKVFDAVDVV